MDIFYPVKLLADWLTYSVFNLAAKTILAEAINFFIYDTIKIITANKIKIFIESKIKKFIASAKIVFGAKPKTA